MRSHTALHRLAGVTLCVALALSGCGPGPAPATPAPSASLLAPPTAAPVRTPRPTPTPEVRRFGTLDLKACSLTYYVRGFCGTLPVLENRAAPDGRRITLRIVLLPARQQPAAPDPVFFLAGGPGDAASVQWLNAGTLFAGLNDERDFVLVDQRGTGGSHRLEYPALPVLTGLSAEEAAAAMQAWRAEALAGLDADPRYYTTAVAMDDLDEVRAALGYDRINLYGNSYGATAAQVYLRRHESRVRAVVLDGGSLLDVNLVERFAPSAQRALDLVLARCEGDADCRAAYPGVRQRLDDAMARLRRRPITIHHPDGSPDSLLTPWWVGSLVKSYLVELSATGGLPQFIDALDQLVASAQGDAVTYPAVLAHTPAPEPLMRWSIMCSEYWARQSVAGVASLAHGTLFEELELEGARQHEAVCAVLPPALADPADGTPVRSDVPVLLLNGEADPQDPPSHVSDAPEELPNSLSVVVPGAAHTVVGLGCLARVVTDFIQLGTAEGLDASCAQAFRPPPFELGE
jgi:pimeloyl-ACP methyl ester carboxylesterase